MTALLLPSRAPQRNRLYLVAGALALALLATAGVLWAQVEGDRGIAPVASTADITVDGIEVNVTGKDSEDARQKGWLEAQRKAWAQLKGPKIPDHQLESLVSAIVIDSETLGPRRYVARLGVIFDRKRAGGLLGAGSGEVSHSAPMLTLPVLISGGAATMYEVRNPWQQAWAEFQAGASAIDYVRPSGANGESLLLTYGQVNRRSRAWWNNILDEFSAADIIVPIARLERQWPGGPIRGIFTARFGPDNTFLGSFTMTAPDEQGLPAMLGKAVTRFDAMFSQALADGKLRPDPTLSRQSIQVSPEIQALIDAARAAERAEASPEVVPTPVPAEPLPSTTPPPGQPQVVNSYAVQFATPDAASYDQALTLVRSAPGVRGAVISSTAIGGVSVMRVSYAGDISDLAAALRSRGFQVQSAGNALSIRR
ncbi:heavy-metal-associated domain-containing protein [Croceibacterium aestuarii]|uniref:heavy-metal-associated domain-containing protein n=1 Tax=Croceibacterium aestuarii TaxID=3064139 RepID=UPI00272EC76D|nr:heavy-metal-associated domain-containing protein [Croceibacterium sp. D39]